MKTMGPFAILLLLGGCATSHTLPGFKELGRMPDDVGVVLLSAGRIDRCAECVGLMTQLPFVSYEIYSRGPDGQYSQVAFIAAEAGMGNQLDKDQYGFVHMNELAAGDYVMVGIEARGQDFPVVIGATAIMIGPGRKPADIAFEFSVEAGKVNYLGEFLTIDRNVAQSSIKVTDRSARDLERLFAVYPALRSYEVTEVVPRPSDARRLDD